MLYKRMKKKNVSKFTNLEILYKLSSFTFADYEKLTIFSGKVVSYHQGV